MKAAVYAGTRNLYSDMIPAVKSLLINSDVEKVYFLIEDRQFPEPLPDIIECMNMQGQGIFRSNGPNYKRRWTYMVLMRAALTKLIPDQDRILSLDVDTIVDRDISELWNLNLDRHYLAAVSEPKKSTLDALYFNVGVVMFNLEKLRSSGMDNRIIRELNNRYYPFCEQDCINELCKRGILPLKSEFNSNDYTKPCENPRIIHFAAIDKWNKFPIVQKYRDIPWSEIRGGSLCVT